MSNVVPLPVPRAIGIREAADMLCVSYGTVYARRKELGFFQIGSVWRIWPEKLREATERYNENRPARTGKEKQECQSESAKGPTSGTLTSARQAATELEKLLAQPIERRLSSSTTS